jgi:predicted acylesterase/phospholipase RssA
MRALRPPEPMEPMTPMTPMAPAALTDGFTLALGGGGARGFAHIGVARALEAHGLRPTRIVGTSMGALIGAGLAAGLSADEIEAAARRMPVYRGMRTPGRYALFDARPLLRRMARNLGDPRIEDLPTPLGITTYDLVCGRPTLLTRGRLVAALARSIAVPLFLPPHRDAAGVWCDAGPWEAVPVSQARAWAPDRPVLGVLVDPAKPAILASRYGAALLRRVALRFGVGLNGDPLTARRYLALLAARWAEPVVDEAPDVLIAPRLGGTSAWQFWRIGQMVERGERDARMALEALTAEASAGASVHAA